MADALERKVANALSDEAAASHVLSELLLEVGAAIGEAERVGEEEREKAMDPALSPDPRKARAAMEDATFAISRLRMLQPRLQQHHEHARCVEEHARWAESYERVRVRRDGFVEELRDRFPKVLAELGVLMASVSKLDDEIRLVNANRPSAIGEPYDTRPVLQPTGAAVAELKTAMEN